MKINRNSIAAQTFQPGRIEIECGIMMHDIEIRGFKYRLAYFISPLTNEAIYLGKIQVFKYALSFHPNTESDSELHRVHVNAQEYMNKLISKTGWSIHNNEWTYT